MKNLITIKLILVATLFNISCSDNNKDDNQSDTTTENQLPENTGKSEGKTKTISKEVVSNIVNAIVENSSEEERENIVEILAKFAKRKVDENTLTDFKKLILKYKEQITKVVKEETLNKFIEQLKID